MDLLTQGTLLISVGVAVVFVFLLAMILFTSLILRFDPAVKPTTADRAASPALAAGSVEPGVVAAIALALHRHHKVTAPLRLPEYNGSGRPWSRSGRTDMMNERLQAQARPGR